MTTITIHRLGEAEVSHNGTKVTVPIVAFSHDADLRDCIVQALETPGVPVPVPSTAKLPKPRNARTYGVAQ